MRCCLFALRKELACYRGARSRAAVLLAHGRRSQALCAVKPMSTARHFIRGLRNWTNKSSIASEKSPRREASRAKIALAWLLHKPAVTAPIVGATKLHHLEEAVAAMDVKLSDAEIDALEAPYVPHPIAGFE